MTSRWVRGIGTGVAGVMAAAVWGTSPTASVPAEKVILVTVLDSAHAPVKGVTASDFAIFEDGVRREVTAVVRTAEPLFVSVLIDTTKVPFGGAESTRDVRAGLLAFVRTLHAASPGAEVALTTVAGANVLLTNFTASTIDLERAIGRLVPDQRSTTVMLEAMIDAARELRRKIGPRRVMLTVDLASRESSQVLPTKVVEQVQNAGVSVWAVSVQGPLGVTAPTRDTTINYLTEATGGVRATALLPSALESILTNVAESLGAQYEVTYARPDGPPARTVTASARGSAKVLVAPWGR